MASLRDKNLFSELKYHFAVLVCGDNRRFLYLAMIYGLAVGLLTLAVPISVQMLINTVANIASIQAIVILSLLLFGLLIFSGGLLAFQSYVLELFERHFYASMTAQFTLRNIHADQLSFRQINGPELTNRYFDIMQVQKIVPSLVTGFFAALLQMLVGIALVSFYHPWLFLFNLFFLFALWTICRIWGYRALGSSLLLSESKYQTARYLEDIAHSSDFYKSETRKSHAIERTNHFTQNYLNDRKKHFRNTFSQEIAFLILYAFANAMLLGLGGVLVVQNELTLGQLVAAELILSAVFFAISRMSYYLVQFYDLNAALEEIFRLYNLKIEKEDGERRLPLGKPLYLEFSDIVSQIREDKIHLDLKIQPGEKVLIKSSNVSIQRAVADLLKRYTVPEKGRIVLGDYDVLDYDIPHLRDRVICIDRPHIVESTIREYMHIYAPNASLAEMNAMLELMGLRETVAKLPQGVDTPFLTSGMPLKSTEVLRLKLAAALLSKPSILVLNEYFDAISSPMRQRIFTALCQRPELTVLYFSNNVDLSMFHRYLYIDWSYMAELEDAPSLQHYDRQMGGEE